MLFCNIPQDNLDNPSCKYIEVGHEMQKNLVWQEKFGQDKRIGYHPMKENFSTNLSKFCHPHGLDQSTPIEPLHCMLLDYWSGCCKDLLGYETESMTSRHHRERNATNNDSVNNMTMTNLWTLSSLVCTNMQ